MPNGKKSKMITLRPASEKEDFTANKKGKAVTLKPFHDGNQDVILVVQSLEVTSSSLPK